VSCPENDVVHATVTGFTKTQYGDIAFATSDKYGTVTFKLSLDVWTETTLPQKGEVVVLCGIIKFPKGWRAMKARRFVLDDDSINS
jgi:hypothetical protein